MTRRQFALLAQGISLPIRGRVISSEVLRRRLRTGMEQVMGPLPGQDRRSPLRPKWHPPEMGEGVTVQKLEYSSSLDERVPALLVKPARGIPNGRAALCLHQTTAIGKREPAGRGGLPNLHYALELAQRGWICLVPDYPTLGEHQVDVYAKGWASCSMKAIWDNIRAIDLLLGLPGVTARQVATIGHSLGGHNSLFTAAFDQRIGCVVSSCGFTRFARYYGGNLAGWSGPRYMPRIREWSLTPATMPFDFDQLLTAIAPTAVFISAPEQDSNFDVIGVKEAVRTASARFRELGAGDRIVAEYPNCGHDWPEPIRQKAYHFMEKWVRR